MSSSAKAGPPSRVDPALAYRRLQPPSGGIQLKLDGNEGPTPALDLMVDALRAAGPELLRRYPDATALEAALAQRCGVEAARVLVTAGADGALDRCCRAFLPAGASMLVPVPSFEMLDRYAALAGGELVPVPWTPGPFPIAAMLERVDERTAIIAIVSPNNPTGEVATLDDVRRLSCAAPNALVLLDHAYVEYAEEDLTASALALPNAVVTRTFSKARGLAGCRVGFVLGSAEVISALRAADGPYPVAAPSLAFAAVQLERGEGAMAAHVAQVRRERAALSARLAARGVAPRRSQANFVYADLGQRAAFVHAALAAQGILVRDFPDRPAAATGLRITLPGDSTAFERLTAALELALAPDALLLDLDGVLADVEGSSRACVLATANDFGVSISRDELLHATLRGDANNDWVLTRRLLAAHGVERSLEEITARYQAHYLGIDGAPGLREAERLIVARDVVAALAGRLPLAIVTGRPRAEAEWFLARAGIRDLVRTIVTLEDAPNKPDPAPVALALERLGATRGWMVGDTPDDARAARGAGVLPLGVTAPGESRSEVAPALVAAGAALVLDQLADLLEVL
ncbi:MAG TPA: aminotransferase class I/II-fold pyridoxal phosphate-dependent enzyme [Gemmatimonadales bacterium]